MYLHNPMTERLVRISSPDEIADAADLIGFYTFDYIPPPVELTEDELADIFVDEGGLLE